MLPPTPDKSAPHKAVTSHRTPCSANGAILNFEFWILNENQSFHPLHRAQPSSNSKFKIQNFLFLLLFLAALEAGVLASSVLCLFNFSAVAFPQRAANFQS
jgi:hypothetical protein